MKDQELINVSQRRNDIVKTKMHRQETVVSIREILNIAAFISDVDQLLILHICIK